MVVRSRGKGEDLTNTPELLRVVGEARRALLQAQSRIRPMARPITRSRW